MTAAEAVPTPAAARPELAGHLALIAVQLCFGLLPLFGKWAFEDFAPRAVASWRMGGGALVFLALAFALHGRRALPARRDLLRLQMCALLGIVLNQVLFLEGLQRSTAVNSGLMMLLIPVFTFLLAVGVRQERFSAMRGLGILVAAAGTLQLLLARAPDLSRPYLFGNLLIALNTLSYSGYLVASRPLTARYPSLVLIAWMYALSVWTIPLFAAGTDLVPASAGRAAWLSLGLVLLFPTILGYLLNMFALGRVSASTTAVYVFVQPLISGLAGVLFLGELLQGNTVLAAVAIFTGIWLVVRRRRRSPA